MTLNVKSNYQPYLGDNYVFENLALHYPYFRCIVYGIRVCPCFRTSCQNQYDGALYVTIQNSLTNTLAHRVQAHLFQSVQSFVRSPSPF